LIYEFERKAIFAGAKRGIDEQPAIEPVPGKFHVRFARLIDKETGVVQQRRDHSNFLEPEGTALRMDY
jgi:hypothetical protein